jgi:hypothetical protein
MIKTFSQFITEARRWTEFQPTLSRDYGRDFQDFYFEEGLTELMDEVEGMWSELENEYWWNREGRNFRNGHFAIDAKIHTWPDFEEIRNAVGMTEEELSDESIDSMWWRWIEDQREFFQEDIQEFYSWIDNTGWGGNSGGWLVIVPDVNGEDFASSLEDELMTYHDTKADIKDDEERWEDLIKRAHDPKFLRLIKLGLAQETDDLAYLKKDADVIRELLEKEKSRVEQIWNDLKEISDRPKKFAQNAQRLFTEWAVEEIQER